MPRKRRPRTEWVQMYGSGNNIADCVIAGHKVTVTSYGSLFGPANIAIECEDCWRVLMDWEPVNA